MPSPFIATCMQLAPVIYLLLTVTALISLFSPLLEDLATHGKIRDSTKSFTNRSSSKDDNLILLLMRNPRQLFLQHTLFQMSKRRFRDFYTFGFLWAIVLGPDLGNDDILLPEILLYSHLVRRWYECQFVHIWNGGTMHIAGYALGLLHYILLPFIFMSSATSEKIPLFHQHNLVVNMFGVGLNIFAQYKQYIHHCLLAYCRNNLDRSDRIEIKDRDGRQHYSIPHGGWFEYICCPHYLAEILIYVSFAILLHDRLYQERQNTKGESYLPHLVVSYCSCLQSYRHIIMFVWVATNLSISARSNLEWYQKQFPMFAKERKALIPLIW